MTRRPIKTRGAAWVQGTARWLTSHNITPNQISQMSMLFALIALACFAGVGLTGLSGLPHPAILLLATALCIQLRLLCNLLDGIVAVEGGKSAPDGPFWNEAPDRAADLFILTGLGLSCGAPGLGLLASALAITTAYIRELGRAEGMQADFSGPLAKPQRMAAATIAAVLAAIATLIAPGIAVTLLEIALWIITIGTGATVFLRSKRLITWMKAKG
jgi:phosphatidylglycerophosphate synthase